MLPPTPKLTLSQTLTLTGGQFSLGAVVWLRTNPKTNPDLDPNPNPNRGAIFLGGQLSGYHFLDRERDFEKIFPEERNLLEYENKKDLITNLEKIYNNNLTLFEETKKRKTYL